MNLANENYCPNSQKKAGKGANRHRYPKGQSLGEARRCARCGYKEGTRMPSSQLGLKAETDLGGRRN